MSLLFCNNPSELIIKDKEGNINTIYDNLLSYTNNDALLAYKLFLISQSENFVNAYGPNNASIENILSYIKKYNVDIDLKINNKEDIALNENLIFISDNKDNVREFILKTNNFLRGDSNDIILRDLNTVVINEINENDPYKYITTSYGNFLHNIDEAIDLNLVFFLESNNYINSYLELLDITSNISNRLKLYNAFSIFYSKQENKFSLEQAGKAFYDYLNSVIENTEQKQEVINIINYKDNDDFNKEYYKVNSKLYKTSKTTLVSLKENPNKGDIVFIHAEPNINRQELSLSTKNYIKELTDIGVDFILKEIKGIPLIVHDVNIFDINSIKNKVSNFSFVQQTPEDFKNINYNISIQKKFIENELFNFYNLVEEYKTNNKNFYKLSGSAISLLLLFNNYKSVTNSYIQYFKDIAIVLNNINYETELNIYNAINNANYTIDEINNMINNIIVKTKGSLQERVSNKSIIDYLFKINANFSILSNKEFSDENIIEKKAKTAKIKDKQIESAVDTLNKSLNIKEEKNFNYDTQLPESIFFQTSNTLINLHNIKESTVIEKEELKSLIDNLENDENPLVSELTKLFKDSLLLDKLVITKSFDKGNYNAYDNSITISSTIDSQKEFNTVFMHEFIHAGTVKRIEYIKNNLSKVSKEDYILYNELKELIDFAKKKAIEDNKDFIAFLDEHEFISHMFTDKEFFMWANNIEYKEKSFFSKLLDTLLRLLGVRKGSIAHSAIEIAFKLMNNKKETYDVNIVSNYSENLIKYETLKVISAITGVQNIANTANAILILDNKPENNFLLGNVLVNEVTDKPILRININDEVALDKIKEFLTINNNNVFIIGEDLKTINKDSNEYYDTQVQIDEQINDLLTPIISDTELTNVKITGDSGISESVIKSLLSNNKQVSVYNFGQYKFFIDKTTDINDETYYKNRFDETISKESKPKIIIKSTMISRDEAKLDSSHGYIFTDNLDRTSVSSDNAKKAVDKNSWYYKKYGKDKEHAIGYADNPTYRTLAELRGLDNAFPITTVKYFRYIHENMSVEDAQFTDADFELFKETIDKEIEDIKDNMTNGMIFKLHTTNKIGSTSRSKLPIKLQAYLDDKLAEIGIDNYGNSPKVIYVNPTNILTINVEEADIINTLKSDDVYLYGESVWSYYKNTIREERILEFLLNSEDFEVTRKGLTELRNKYGINLKRITENLIEGTIGKIKVRIVLPKLNNLNTKIDLEKVFKESEQGIIHPNYALEIKKLLNYDVVSDIKELDIAIQNRDVKYNVLTEVIINENQKIEKIKNYVKNILFERLSKMSNTDSISVNNIIYTKEDDIWLYKQDDIERIIFPNLLIDDILNSLTKEPLTKDNIREFINTSLLISYVNLIQDDNYKNLISDYINLPKQSIKEIKSKKELYNDAKNQADNLNSIPQNYNGKLPDDKKAFTKRIPTIIGDYMAAITMMQKGIRKRSTRSEKEIIKYFGSTNPEDIIGKYIKQFGYNEKGQSVNLYTIITDFYDIESPKHKANFYKEGWIDSHFDELDKGLKYVIEFEVITEDNIDNIKLGDNTIDISDDQPVANPVYFQKDKLKFSKCNKFIGRGSEKSSSRRYAINAYKNKGIVNGYKIETGKSYKVTYTKDDIVGITAEGNRTERIDPDFDEILLAINAGSTIITDTKNDRNRTYNIGERQVAIFLFENGYREKNESGIWIKEIDVENKIPAINKQYVYDAERYDKAIGTKDTFLSNFEQIENPIIDEYGNEFYNSEGYYMSLRTENESEKKEIAIASKESGKKSRAARFRYNLEQNEVLRAIYMKKALYEKFTRNPKLIQELLNTGDNEIIEKNYWGDDFFGVPSQDGTRKTDNSFFVKNKGANILGKLLMSLRDYFRNSDLKLPETINNKEIEEINYNSSEKYTEDRIKDSLKITTTSFMNANYKFINPIIDEYGNEFYTSESYMYSLLTTDKKEKEKLANSSKKGDLPKNININLEDFDINTLISVINDATIEKFKRNPNLLDMLKNTKDKEIIYLNGRFDNILGVVDFYDVNSLKNKALPYEGYNILGKVLMNIRKSFDKKIIQQLAQEHITTLEKELSLLENEIDSENQKSELLNNKIISLIPKLNTDSVKKETGLTIGIESDINPNKVSKNGPSIEKAAENIYNSLSEEEQVNTDVNDIRNIIIDFLSNPLPYTDNISFLEKKAKAEYLKKEINNYYKNKDIVGLSAKDIQNQYIEDTYYGFYAPNGEIFVDKTILSTNNLFHEFYHLYDDIIMSNYNYDYRAKSIIDRANQLIREFGYLEKVKQDSKYNDKGLAFMEAEARAMMIGDASQKIMEKAQDNYLKKIYDFLKDLVDYILDLIGTKSFKDYSPEDILNMTMQEFTNVMTRDMLYDKSFDRYKKIGNIPFSELTTIKSGVEELFESNPEFSSQIYEALGFNTQNVEEEISKLDNPINKNINKILNITIPSDVYPEEVQEELHGLDVGDTFVIEYNDGQFNLYSIYPDVKVKIGSYINKEGKLDFGAYDFKKFLGKSLIAQDISSNDITTILLSSDAEDDFRDYEYLKEFIEDEYTITTQQKQQALQLYSQYLDTIFPDSKVKDIVYHGTNTEFEVFDKTKLRTSKAFHFSNLKETLLSKIKMPVLLNITNPIDEMPSRYEQDIIDDRKKQGYDGVITDADYREYERKPELGKEYVVFEPEQIHILSSKKDLEMFRNFINFTKSEYAKYGDIQQFKDYIMSKNFAAIEEFLVVNNKIDRKC